MWAEELRLENVRSFESEVLSFTSSRNTPYRWITFLGENGGGKSTALQALALLLAGPEAAQILNPRPAGWPRDESVPGRLSIRIRQGANDPGQFGKDKVRHVFGYSYSLTGSKRLTINNRVHTEPSIVPAGQTSLSWLRENAFASQGSGWFAVGYGAFRRLTRLHQVLVPSLEPQARFTNFLTQFDEREPLSAVERWLVYLDYRIAKSKDHQAKRQLEIGMNAVNDLLPEGVRFDRVTEEGRIVFDVKGQKVPTIALSDGYRSMLALAGDLVRRMIQAFPESDKPLEEEGVVLVDELDIHLHPVWQREVAGLLRNQFPGLQFIVATHSPFVAAGAGDDSLILKFRFEEGQTRVERIEDSVAAWDVGRILESKAFGHVSPYSPETQDRIDRFDLLARKGSERTRKENVEYQTLLTFMEEARPLGGVPEPDSLVSRMDAYLDKVLE